MDNIVSLNNDEINTAITEYITSQGVNTTNKSIAVSVVAGRKGNGLRAEISITDVNSQSPKSVDCVDKGTEQQLDLVNSLDDAAAQERDFIGANGDKEAMPHQPTREEDEISSEESIGNSPSLFATNN